MNPRINWFQIAPEIVQAMAGVSDYWRKSGLEESLVDLMLMRASQINHCAYCLDMHSKDARVSGETEQRLYGLDAWREAPYYTDRERAALAWTEAVTLLTNDFVPDEVYEQVRPHFTETEMIALTMVVIGINSWNRLTISMRTPAGHYVSKRRPHSVTNAETT
jgi:AhpD family alkylhydroperoxidase